MKLTDRFVDTLPLPVKGNKRVPDSELPGFNALITKAGWRGYVLRYRIRGRARSYTIGSRSAWSTIAARNRARELRRLIDQGIDPHEREAQERNEAITVGEFWTRVYAPLHLPNLRPATRRNIRSMMVRDVLPRIGRVPVKELDRGDVAALHREVSKRAPIRANRVRTAISSLMSWAEQPHVLEDSSRIRPLRPLGSNPCRGVRLNPEERRQRFLTPAEISRLIAALDGRHARQERSSVALVKFLLLTGARFSEAARADWSQFDLTAGIWVKPSSHTKQKRTHTTPLAAPALALLQQLGETTSSEFLFPGRDGRPLTKVASLWRSVTREAGLAGVRIHDLRHSFASLLASGGESLLLIGQLLGHSNPAVTARYAHLIDDVQRQAVERVAAVITGQPLADVVPMRQKKR